MAKIDAIKRVQEAEAKAKAMVDNANKEKAEIVEKAKQSASKIIEDANAKVNELRASATEETAKEFEKEKSRALSEARKQAEKLKKAKAGRSVVEKAKSESIRKILGE